MKKNPRVQNFSNPAGKKKAINNYKNNIDLK